MYQRAHHESFQYFLGSLSKIHILNQYKAPEPLLKPVPCWYSYIIASMFPLFFILGVITQHMATAKQYKKKVERVYVPPTVVNVYGTIRRTLGRSRDGMSRQIDYRPAGRSSNGGGGGRSRSNGQSRSQRNGRSSGNSRESSRLPSAPNPDSVTSPNLSRAARSRDRARQSGRRMAQNIFNQNQPDQQRLINQTNSNNQQQQQQQSRPNKHQVSSSPETE